MSDCVWGVGYVSLFDTKIYDFCRSFLNLNMSVCAAPNSLTFWLLLFLALLAPIVQKDKYTNM